MLLEKMEEYNSDMDQMLFITISWIAFKKIYFTNYKELLQICTSEDLVVPYYATDLLE